MAEIHIPFTKGQSEAVDPKLLPQGLFVRAENVRYRKDARLAVRNAYVNDGAITTANVIAGASYGPKYDTLISKRTASNTPPSMIRHSGGAFNAVKVPSITQDGPTGSVGVFEQLGNYSAALGNTAGIATSDLLVSGGAIFVVVGGYNLSSKAIVDPVSGLTVYKIEQATGRVLLRVLIGSSTDAQNAKLVIVNGSLCVFWAKPSTSTVRMVALNTSSFGIVTAELTVVASTAGKAMYFDVSPGGASTEAYLVYHKAASTLEFGTVTSAGVFSAFTTIASTNNEARPSICATGLAPTDQIAIVWNDGATFITGNAKYTVYRRSSASFIIGTTSVDTSGNVTGYPVVGPNADTDWIGAFNVASAGAPRFVGTYSSGGTATYITGQQLASKPVVAGSIIGLVTTDIDDVTAERGAYYFYDVRGGGASAGTPLAEAYFGPLIARASDTGANISEPRRQIAATTANSTVPGNAAIVVALPTMTDATSGWMLYVSEYGPREPMFQSAQLNGELYFSGARTTVYDQRLWYEAGLPMPVIISAVAGAGAIAAGTYEVVVVFECFDALGNRHRSAPSLPATVSLGAPGGIVVTWTPPQACIRLKDNDTKVYARIYRTTAAQPTIFTDGNNTQSAQSEVILGLVTLALADASILTNEVLYTQGASGGLSGLLANDRPPASRFIWAGSDRLIVGGLENVTGVQWSKFRVQGEPMQWSDFDAYKANVEGRVTAVAELDGTWIIFTASSIWTVSGPGPDDNGAGGSFDVPRRLPTDIGCISAKSLVMTGQGLIFQGAADRMYLLPRGGGGPQWVGQHVRDTMAAFPFVSASAFDRDSNVAYWALCDSAASTGKLIVFDTRINEWYVDTFFTRAIKALSIYDGKLVIDGGIIESASSYQDSDGSSTASVIPVLEMGDLRPFGQSGYGRIRRMTLMGELREATPTPTIEISYDSGRSYGESVSFTLSGSAGDPITLEHMPVTIRGTQWRPRFSWTTASASEGIIFNGLSLEGYQAPGLKKLGPTARA